MDIDREEIIAKMVADYHNELQQLNDVELLHTFRLMGKPEAVAALADAMTETLMKKAK